MQDANYLADRAQQELTAAIRTSNPRVRERHLELADAYAFRLRELKRQTLLARTLEAESAG